MVKRMPSIKETQPGGFARRPEKKQESAGKVVEKARKAVSVAAHEKPQVQLPKEEMERLQGKLSQLIDCITQNGGDFGEYIKSLNDTKGTSKGPSLDVPVDVSHILNSSDLRRMMWVGLVEVERYSKRMKIGQGNTGADIRTSDGHVCTVVIKKNKGNAAQKLTAQLPSRARYFDSEFPLAPSGGS